MSLSPKSAIAFLILASASLVGAQTLQTLYSFTGGSDGTYPYAGLTLGSDGNFYGTTGSGGITNSEWTGGMGTVFRVTTSGTLTTLFAFSGTNGVWPTAGLTLGNDGNFYGTTEYGGSNYWGTVFKLTTNGTLTTLDALSFASGANPRAALALGSDGNFYGTTWSGGSNGRGTVFQVTTNGTLTILVSFNFTNGASPGAALTPGNDGNFYGTTYYGGITNSTDLGSMGSVFKVTGSGTLTTLIPFNSSNGANPWAALTLGSDGSFYGTTYYGGNTNFAYPYGQGTVFKVTTNGTLTTLVEFNSTNGAGPFAGLTLGSDGTFYGTTAGGGECGYGSVFRLSSQPLITVQPQSQTSHAGGTATFFLSATSPYPMVYQWQKNGTNLVNGGNISGATTSTLTITSVSDRDAASYSVIVANSYGAASSSNAVLTVDDALFIALQPQSQTVGLGSNVTFGVTVYGAPPLVFQWYFNGTPLGPPATGTNLSSCTLTNVGANEAGSYSVLVVNDHGSLMSSNAVLAVQVFPPNIGLQPLSQNVMLGKNASFSVSVSGTPPFHYQWRCNGAGIPNATNAAYTIQGVGAGDTGNYSVVVTNLAGSVTSSNAFLTVIVPPTLALQLWAGYPLLDLNGMLSSNFVVQYSTNLAGSNWMPLLSLTNLPASPYLFLDPAGDAEPARFYRALMR